MAARSGFAVTDGAAFKDYLATERVVMAELAAALESEYALARGEPTLEELELACRQRRRLSLRLLECRQRRRDFDPQQPGAAADLWRALQADARHCRALNERVGALVAARLHQLSGLLSVLGGPQNALRYAADAQVDRRPQSTLTARV